MNAQGPAWMKAFNDSLQARLAAHKDTLLT